MKNVIKRLSLHFSILIWLAMLLLNFSFAQNAGKISGIVIDNESGEAIVGCNIMIEEMLMGAATDADGYFVILNVPAGSYELKAVSIGYKTEVRQSVKVVSNLNTKVNFQLIQQVLEGEEIVVTGYAVPSVQKDLTHKVQAVSAAEIAQVPISNVTDILTQQAGIVKSVPNTIVSSLPAFGQFATVPTDGLHFRGGRENEALYLFDGINVGDALWGGYSIDQLGELAISSLETYSGTFGPQYGDAMSGVVNISTSGVIKRNPAIALKVSSDNHGIGSASHNTNLGEFYMNSPMPYTDKLGLVVAHRSYSTDGYIFGKIYPNYVNSEGRDKSGKAEEVPMQYLDTQFSFAKLNWRPSSSFKVSLGGYIAKTNKGVYNHYFKYNPYGTPRVNLDDKLIYGTAQYLINDKSYINMRVANYRRGFIARVYDDFSKYNVLPQNGSGEFSISGEDWVYFETTFGRQEISLDYANQLNKVHHLSAGITYDKLLTELERRNPDGGLALEEYRYEPTEIGAFINEKMEFEDMGMIINAGLRFDYVQPNRDVLSQIENYTNPDAGVEKSEAIISVTPRLGISFPVAEQAAIRFGYGHYFQYPDYFKIFQGTVLIASTGQYRPNPQIENTPIALPDIKPEKTVNYETGVQYKVNNAVSLDITGFYRKTSNLIGITLSETNEGKRFNTLGNIDYATVKGIELSLKKRFTNKFSAFFNYTFSKTLVSTSVLFERATDEARTFPANWDQPHAFSGNVHFEAENGFGFSLFGSASSGFPYTRSAFEPNGERSPWIHQLDINIFKNFDWFDFKQQLFVQVFNIVNRRNIWWVYSDSGIAGDDANESTSHDYTNNPSMYGPQRTIQIGFKIWN